MKGELLSQLGAGVPGAAEDVLERYGALVWSLARRYSRDPAEAEDAVQEIFVSLWKNAARFDPAKASEATFISMIARRRLIDLHRRKESRPEATSHESELETMPDLDAAQVERRVEARLAARAIVGLESKERQALVMSIYHGMSHSEISREMAMPLGTVKTYIRRGLLRVKETLAAGNERQ